MGSVACSNEYIVELISKSKKNQINVDSFTNENNFLHENKKCLLNTPVELPRILDKEFSFTFTLCVHDDKVPRSRGYRTSEKELLIDWQGETVFCNLSYCNENTRWIKKCYEESKKLNTMVVMLIPIMDNNPYFRDIVYNKARQIRFIKCDLKGFSTDNSNAFKGVVVVF